MATDFTAWFSIAAFLSTAWSVFAQGWVPPPHALVIGLFSWLDLNDCSSYSNPKGSLVNQKHFPDAMLSFAVLRTWVQKSF